MRRFFLTAMMVCAVGSAQAQSMNIPEIVETTLNEVCGPWMQTGDRGGAVRAAEALGYRTFDLNSGRPADAAAPPSRILADGSLRHRGQIVLIESRDRVCSVDMAEATPGQISELAADTLTAMGMERVLDRREGGVQVVVWAGENRQAVIAPSTQSSGAALTLSWRRPDPRAD